jgi:hypothetical protein
MVALRWESYQSREGRMSLVDIVGRNHRLRTLPMPLWAQADLDAWYIVSREPPPEPSYSLRHLERTRPRNMDYVAGGMSADAVHDLVRRYGREMGRDLTPSDLRRTLVRMLWRGGAGMEQIREILGHQSIACSVRYLEASPDFQNGPRDIGEHATQGVPANEGKNDELGRSRENKRGRGTVGRHPQWIPNSVREYLVHHECPVVGRA